MASERRAAPAYDETLFGLPISAKGRSRLWRAIGSRVGVLGPLALVTLQVIINSRIGQISDVRHLYFAHHLHSHPLPYVDTRIEYPVLVGLYMTAAAAVTHSVGAYLTVSNVGLWASAVGCTYLLWDWSPKRAWWFALCPLLSVDALLNWDLFAILLMLLGWHAWRRERFGLAGMWLALGTFAKLYPVFLLFFCLVELVRSWRRDNEQVRGLVRFVTAAVAASAVVNIPFAVLAFRNWSYFWTSNAARNEHADLLSWLHLIGRSGNSLANVVIAATVVAAFVVGARAVWRDAKVAHVAAAAFFAYMLVQKVNSPQYTLWLVTFALIAEWEFWTIGVLSIMGVADYANSAVHIALVQTRSTLMPWYERHIYRLDEGLRLATTLAVLVTMLYKHSVGRWATRLTAT